MAITDTFRGMSINEWCRLYKLPCSICNRLFHEGEGVALIRDLATGSPTFYHYPTCPILTRDAPSSESAVPRLNHNVDESWE